MNSVDKKEEEKEKEFKVNHKSREVGQGGVGDK